jgi:hypothetical protein
VCTLYTPPIRRFKARRPMTAPRNEGMRFFYGGCSPPDTEFRPWNVDGTNSARPWTRKISPMPTPSPPSRGSPEATSASSTGSRSLFLEWCRFGSRSPFPQWCRFGSRSPFPQWCRSRSNSRISGKAVTPSARPAAPPATHAGAARPRPASADPAPKAAISGPGLAQRQVNGPALGALSAVAGYFAPSSDPEATPHAEVLLWLSAAQGSSGSSTSGPGGEGAQTAGDAAGLWTPWDARSGAQAPDLAQAPTTSPSFDPGSSPD